MWPNQNSFFLCGTDPRVQGLEDLGEVILGEEKERDALNTPWEVRSHVSAILQSHSRLPFQADVRRKVAHTPLPSTLRVRPPSWVQKRVLFFKVALRQSGSWLDHILAFPEYDVNFQE